MPRPAATSTARLRVARWAISMSDNATITAPLIAGGLSSPPLPPDTLTGGGPTAPRRARGALGHASRAGGGTSSPPLPPDTLTGGGPTAPRRARGALGHASRAGG